MTPNAVADGVLAEMCEHYRRIRKVVYENARDHQKFRGKVTRICNAANLSLYGGTDPEVASAIWHHLWTKNRYAGIRASTASKEIKDIESIFDQFATFSDPSWDIEIEGHTLVSGGDNVHHFLNRTGIFEGCQTIGNLPKLRKIVDIARKIQKYLSTREDDTPVLDFVTGGHSVENVWEIHRHLMNMGYTADLTALHFMMDLGFQVVKPDIIMTRLFLDWGWLHRIIPNLPSDLSCADLIGKGKYRSRFKYEKPALYQPCIDLARKIAGATRREDLEQDVGWVTDNPLREFDIFIVKFDQEPEEDFGLACAANRSRKNPQLFEERSKR